MRNYRIVIETGADYPRELVQPDNVEIAPMHVTLGDTDYPETAISVEELFGYREKTGKLPSTSAVNPEDYRKAFDKIRAEDPDSIILHVSYSSKVSATFQNAHIAAEGYKNIYHADSINCSGGQAMVAMRAVELVREHPELEPEEMVRRVEAVAALTRFSFLPGSLEYLRAGGRVSNAQYLGATVLNLKPLIEIQDGFLNSTKKYRGQMKSVAQQMLEEYFSKYKINKRNVLFIYSLGLSDEVRALAEKIAKEHGVQEFRWSRAGCVISTHAGPGALGIIGVED